MSKTGGVHFYMFGGESPKQVSQQLNLLTGRAPMPNILSLGFHYSTWDEETSAQVLIDRANNFTKFGFPVDYLWLDLPYTREGNYFDFDPKGFPERNKS
jgi:alpha-glucosidase